MKMIPNLLATLFFLAVSIFFLIGGIGGLLFHSSHINCQIIFHLLMVLIGLVSVVGYFFFRNRLRQCDFPTRKKRK